jgi:serine/threonine-protein kinase
LYIAMKLIKGRTLAVLLGERGRKSAPSPHGDTSGARASGLADDLPRFISIFEQVCQAMAYAHSCGVIHRDLKPSNVMVGKFGEVQVMDWGLAKVVDQDGVADFERSLRKRADSGEINTFRSGSAIDESHSGSVLGTPAYMAPEQAGGRLDTLDERADVFGLGAILCEILTGKPPYTGATEDELYRKAERGDQAELRARLDDCGAESGLVALAKACLSVAPKDRPRDAGVVAAALTNHLAGAQERLKAAELAQAKAESRADEEKKRRLLTLGFATAVLGMVMLGTGGGAWIARDRATRALETEREVSSALHAASLALTLARAAPECDPALWIEATQAAKRAETLLSRSLLRDELRREIQNVVAATKREGEQANARSKGRNIVKRLTEIHADFANHLDRRRTDGEYSAAFREYGIDVDQLDPGAAAARVAASPVAMDLVDALDQWTFNRRGLRPTDPQGVRRLVATARGADPNPWRNRLRDALDLEAADSKRASAVFAELALSATPLDLRGESASRLAFVLSHRGDHDTAVSLLSRVQRSQPDDFWINCDLAAALLRKRVPDQAVRFYSIAVALRPQNELARKALSEALRAAGRGDEAAAYEAPKKRATHQPAAGPPHRSALPTLRR